MLETKIEAAPAPREDWHSYIVDENWSRYTRADHDTWDRLYERQVKLLADTVVSPFLTGLKRLGLDEPGIPQIAKLSKRLEHATGWKLVPVAGIVPDGAFFAMLEDKVFPIGNFIRDGGNLDYLEEPDCFHDIFGHVPVLAHEPMADLMLAMGKLGVKACADGHADLISRMYWHTVEFGLAKEDGQTKIWGAGLASSFGEAHFSLEAEVPRPRFTIEDAAHTPYRSDRFQPLYFVSDSLEASARALEACTIEELEALGESDQHGYAPDGERLADISG